MAYLQVFVSSFAMICIAMTFGMNLGLIAAPDPSSVVDWMTVRIVLPAAVVTVVTILKDILTSPKTDRTGAVR